MWKEIWPEQINKEAIRKKTQIFHLVAEAVTRLTAERFETASLFVFTTIMVVVRHKPYSNNVIFHTSSSTFSDVVPIRKSYDV